MSTSKIDQQIEQGFGKDAAEKWSMKPNPYDMDGSPTAFSHSRKEPQQLNARFVFLVTLLSLFSVIGGVAGGRIYTGMVRWPNSVQSTDWLAGMILGALGGCFAVLLIWAVAEKITAPRK